MSGTSNPLTLTPVEGDSLTPITVSPERPQTLGRGVHCDIRLTHPSVSKRHAELRWADTRWHVTDLESLNGTHVNEEKLRPGQPARVYDGDRVRLGASTFQANIPDDERTTPRQRSATYVTQVTLLNRLKDEDTQMRELSWREFRARYAPVIAGFARNAGLRPQDSDDVLQEVLLGFYQVSGSFEYDPAKGRFRGYLKRATLNVIRKRCRGSGGKHNASLTDLDIMDDHAPSLETAWERAWAEQIMERAIEAAKARVDEKTFEAFERYTRRNIDAEVVAEQLGMNVNSVHQAKSRVMAMIADLVDQLRQEEG